MADAKTELTQNWLIKAMHDLTAAQLLANSPDAILDTAIYHCQQAAEKSIKGFLVWQDHELEKTHDVLDLVESAMQHDISFQTLSPNADLLTPYAVMYRYPSDDGQPDQDEFEKAFAAAKNIVDFVLAHLPVETHP